MAALARLHAVPVAGAPADGPWVQLLQQPLLQVAAGAARALGADGSDALLALASAAQAQLHGQRAPTVLVHGDCKPGNMVVTRDGRLVLVDLAGLRRGDAALDIAHMCTRIDADGDTCRLAVALYLQHRQEPEGFTPLLARVEAWQMALQVRLLARHAGTDMAELVPLVAGRLAEQMAQASEPGEADAPAGDRLSP